MTSMQLSLGLARDLGYHPVVVEKFNPHAGPHGKRQDLFGIADIEALAADHTLYVQATMRGELAEHFGKLIQEPLMPRLLECTARRVEIWSWDKIRGRWACERYRACVNGETNRVVFVGAA